MLNIIHVSHEAVWKVGGIGTVLEGLINSRPYRDQVARTLLVCPLFYPERAERLGPGGIVEYSSLDHAYQGPYANAFQRIERDFNIHLVYGRRPIIDLPTARQTLCEVLLVDLRGINLDRINALKGQLWERFGLHSDRYQHIWEFEQYVQLAGPATAAVEALGLATNEIPAPVFAHEFMGLPTALALAAQHPQRYRTLFHAHEVAPVRRIVEHHAGHDVMFYNAMRIARRNDLTLEEVFGSQDDYFKYPLVNAAAFCDAVLAVGHHVVRELDFQDRDFQDSVVNLAYNGIPSEQMSFEEKQDSRRLLRGYCRNLLGWEPTHVFSHVTRMAVSKALWRDLDVLAAMEPALAEQNETAVLIVLSTEMPTKAHEEILRMEAAWNWPVAHREGQGDLTPGEADFYQEVQAFNARSRNVRVLYFNQFGFGEGFCGERVPEGLDLIGLRSGADVEFGLSLYEPFGISPLEPLTYGALCAVSSSCGCAGFVAHAAGRKQHPNIVPGDYIGARSEIESLPAALAVDRQARRRVEKAVAARVAEGLVARLPRTDEQVRKLLKSGYELARRMSWDVVAESFIFPAVQKASARRRLQIVA